MRAWYVPSWNGDIRLEEHKEGALLTAIDPTPAEITMVEDFLKTAREKKWTESEKLPPARKLVLRDVTVAEAGHTLCGFAVPKKKVLTAVVYSDGKVTATEKAEEAAAEAKKDEDSKATTVKRATPCCPACIPGVVNLHANEVLEAFLTPQQKRDWNRYRMIEIEGGYTGHRYLLAHRNTKPAREWGRMCFDADDDGVIHFYDWSVPPEEEVLGAKLVLEHRENWLRNEATTFAGTRSGASFRDVFKNPFGSIRDGTETAAFFQAVGQLAGVPRAANGIEPAYFV